MLLALTEIGGAILWIIRALVIPTAGTASAMGIGAVVLWAINFVKNYAFAAVVVVAIAYSMHQIYNDVVTSLLTTIPEPFGTYVTAALTAMGVTNVLAWFIAFADLWLSYKSLQRIASVHLAKR